MQAIDDASGSFDFFKKLGVVEVLDTVCAGTDQDMMSQFTRAEANMKVANEYALTWDACDLILNKLPSTKHSEVDKVGFIKEFLFVFVLSLVNVSVVVVFSCGVLC